MLCYHLGREEEHQSCRQCQLEVDQGTREWGAPSLRIQQGWRSMLGEEQRTSQRWGECRAGACLLPGSFCTNQRSV